MIVRGMKNYLSCLKYIFVPLGALFLGIVLGLSIGIPTIGAAIDNLTGEVHNIAAHLSIDPVAFKDSLVNSVGALDWTSPADALKTVLTREWLQDTILSALDALVENSDAYVEQISSAINSLIFSIVSTIVVTIVFAIVSLFVGYFVTKSMIRREIAKRAFWKFLLVWLLESLLSTALVVLFSWLTALWLPGGAISAVVFILLSGAFSLLEAYLIHARGKIKLREILTLQNVVKLFLTNVIIFVLWGVLFLLVTLIFNPIVGTMLGLTLLEITFIVLGMNAESYVKQTIEKRPALLSSNTENKSNLAA